MENFILYESNTLIITIVALEAGNILLQDFMSSVSITLPSSKPGKSGMHSCLKFVEVIIIPF